MVARHAASPARPPARTAADAAAPEAAVAPAAAPAAVAPARAASHAESIVVTGSLFRDPNTRTATPITRLTTQELQRRGIKSVSDALQTLSSNGGGTLTNSWSAGGGFAAGSSAPSLRGLSTDSTLVLMDGQRLSYYPTADDGVRNFVDTNWIPMSIMQNVDVQEDGGSATYGADAVAGVINLITRKQIQGWEANAEGGVAQNGKSGHQRLYLTYGHGDLNRDGYNFYVNGEYQQDDPYYYRQAGHPYNTGDQTSLGGGNGNINVVDAKGRITNFGANTVPVVRPSDGATGGVGPWQLLNPAAGCSGPGIGGLVTGAAATGDGGRSQACESNLQQYLQIAPSLRRINATAHFTANVTDHSQLVAMFNYGQVQSVVTGTNPSAVRVQSQDRAVNTLATPLPVYLPNGQLNPNNPFAAEGLPAEISYRFGDLIPTTTELSQNYRGSLDYSGYVPSSWGTDWNYDANFVGMNSTLDQTITGVPTIAGITNAIESGSYNFVDPSKNSQSVLDSIAPKNHIHARSEEYSLQGTLSKGLFRLPGGMAKLAIGGNFRYEAVDDPSANTFAFGDPNQWTGLINPVSAMGHRWVESGFFEVDAPIIKMLDADVSGRYDHYSEGFSNFSPKVGVVFKPLDKLTLRGTFSKGFRVPSFAETGGQTVGYTTYRPSDQAFLDAHTVNGVLDSYGQSYSLGNRTIGNPNLRPEKSTNFTVGPMFQPTKWLTLMGDYYYIRKNHYITANPINVFGVADAWIANNNAYPSSGLPVSVRPDIEDTAVPPGAPLRPAEIDVSYVNANKLVTDGFDLQFLAHSRLPGILRDVMWISQGRASYIRRMNLTLPNGGGTEHFAGTIGPYGAVSASGNPHWRANWSNTLTYKKVSVTPTVYYTSGYKTTAEDQTGPDSRNDCSNQLTGQFSPPQCHVKAWWDVDLTVNYEITPKLNVYVNVYNLLGFRSPYDFSTYGGYLYNPAWSQNGVVQRNFQFGVHATF